MYLPPGNKQSNMYLNCKTYFSFRYGTMSEKELIKAAEERGVTSLALTNINSTCDLWDFIKDCREAGIKPLAGAEIRNEDELLYILIAANNAGLGWINQFISDHLEIKKPFPEKAGKAFFNNPKDGFVIYPL
ncbi:MAG TPA: PHP domain-containing protein [Hanamia sp.]|nr:PHP domain-containing protein [Hanamia sp.]